MEVIIAIGLGVWFAIVGAVSAIAVFKSFDNKEAN